MDASLLSQLVDFYKLLSEPTRLRLIGLVAISPRSSQELAGLLSLREKDLARHLAHLCQDGLVKAEGEAGTLRYCLDITALEARNAALFRQLEPVTPPDFDGSAAELKVLSAFLDGQTIKAVPAQAKKLTVVLRWLVERFEPGKRYDEREVNAVIEEHHPDYATWRRLLVDYGFMRRERGIYWRA